MSTSSSNRPLVRHKEDHEELKRVGTDPLKHTELVQELDGGPNFRRRYDLVTLAVLVIVLAVNQVLCQALFGTDYVDWYLKYGALITFATSLITVTWEDINDNVGLISAHPLIYVGAVCWILGIPCYSLGTLMRGKFEGRRGDLILDKGIGLPYLIAITVLFFLWAIVVVPAQYFVFLVSGAPVRLAVRCKSRTVACQIGRRLQVDDQPKVDAIPPGCWDASFLRKPVTSTTLLATGLLLIVQLLR